MGSTQEKEKSPSVEVMDVEIEDKTGETEGNEAGSEEGSEEGSEDGSEEGSEAEVEEVAEVEE